jgi:hypothetical protein
MRKLNIVILSPSASSEPAEGINSAKDLEILRRPAVHGTPQNDNGKVSFQMDTHLKILGHGQVKCRPLIHTRFGPDFTSVPFGYFSDYS